MDGRRVWLLTRGGQVLAYLLPDGCSRFASSKAIEGVCKTTHVFERLRFEFERELELWYTSGMELENDEWFEIWERLKAPGFFVESLDGHVRIEIFWVHFAEGRAWWLPLYNSPNTVIRG
jgi:hypothetical protein